MSSDSDLLSVDEMSEIPSGNRSGGAKGGSKGVNLFLARQKLIADMMEQEDEEQPSPSGTGGGDSTVRSNAKDNQYISTSNRPLNNPTPSIPTVDHGQQPSVGSEVEIPTAAESASGGKSKGVNLFLARQKQIADMMKAEEEAERAAEEEKKRAEEERIKREEKERKLAEEQRKRDEIKRQEQEKLLESQRAAAARAARFKPPKQQAANHNASSGPEPDLSWVKKPKDESSSSNLHISDDDDEGVAVEPVLRKSESPKAKRGLLSFDANRNAISPADSSYNGVSHLLDAPILKLPKSQPPTVTLLQKSRVSPFRSLSADFSSHSSDISDFDMNKIRECLDSQSGFISMHAGDIPRGALYIGTNEKIVGGLRQSDTFYLVSPSLAESGNNSANRINAVNEDNSSSGETTTNRGKSTSSGDNTTNVSVTSEESLAHRNTNSSSITPGNNNASSPEQLAASTGESSSPVSGNGGASVLKSDQRTQKPKVPQKPCRQDAERARRIYSESRSSISGTLSLDIDETNANYPPTQPQSIKEEPSCQTQHQMTKHQMTQHQITQHQITQHQMTNNMTVSSDTITSTTVVTTTEESIGTGMMSSTAHDPEGYVQTTPLSITTASTLESDNPFNRSETNSPSLASPTTGPLSPKLLYKEIQKGGEIPLSGLRKPAPITPPHRGMQFYDNTVVSGGENCLFSKRISSLHRRRRRCSSDRQRKCRSMELLPSHSGALGISEHQTTHSRNSAGSDQPLNSRNTNCTAVQTNRCSSSGGSPVTGTIVDKAYSEKDCESVSSRGSWCVSEEFSIRSTTPLTVRLKDIEKVIPPPLAGYDRAPAPLPREQRDHIDAKRKELLLRLEKDGRRKKAREEEADRRSRRHSDNFTVKDKSPIPRDRYDDALLLGSPHSPAARSSISSLGSPRSIADFNLSPIKARVLYTFKSQHPRELTAYRGDIVNVIRQVDRNWYEARSGSSVGIIPVSYIKILKEPSHSPPPVRPAPPRLLEGSGVAKFSFNSQSPVELALKKGDKVILLRRVDSNWYEGRLQTSDKSGIFPVTYIQVISEPDAASVSSPNTSPAFTRSKSVPNESYRRQRSMLSPQRVCVSPITRAQPSDNLLYIKTQSSHTGENYPGIRNETSKAGVDRSCTSGLEMPSYKSLFNYSPRNGDELELKEGDIVHVIEKCKDGWYVGTSGRTGLFGTFPGNYVTPV